MIRQLLPAIVLFVLSCAGVSAQEIPQKLYGNWLIKDGSNQFIFGLTPHLAIYDNGYWDVKAVVVTGDHLQLTIGHPQQTKKLDFFLTEGKDTVLKEGRRKYTISKSLYYDPAYRPAKKQWKQPWFQRGTAHIKGVFPRGAARPAPVIDLPMEYHEVQVSYYNVFLGKKVYYYATFDSSGAFEMDIPVFKPQLVELAYPFAPKKTIARFVVEPGNRILLVKDNNNYAEGTDRNAVLQSTAFMGDNAAFNNLYQFAIPKFGFNELLPSRKESFASQYSRLNQAIDNMYDPSTTEKRFLDFLREEITYSISALTEQINLEKGDMPVIDSILSKASSTSILHDKFYECADWYSRRKYLDMREEERSVETTEKEVVPVALHDLGQAISRALQLHYTDVPGPVYGPLDEGYIWDRYVTRGHDNADKLWGLSLIELWHIERRILRAYKEDSVRYNLNRSLMKSPEFHFAANVSTVLTNHKVDILKQPLPGLYRLYKFPIRYDKKFPTALFVQYQREAAVNYASSSFTNINNFESVQQIDDETSWKEAQKFFYGKTVVFWPFDIDYDEAKVSHQLYEIQQLEARFKSKPVLFVKCIRGDQSADGNLTRYLEALHERNMEQNVCYLLRGNSLDELFQKKQSPLVMDITGRFNHLQTNGSIPDPDVKPIHGKEPDSQQR